ncbi:MAG: LutB/LldF family L-lactate oxidation iron-sulfur protein [Acidobacteriia bacterium]|nr:LutB/LldF family L-lactate oxidation iron-sulfur protein [Terriglobia bacterium]
MSSGTIPFKNLARKNLADVQLRGNLLRATQHSLAARASAVSEVPEWELLRTAAHAIKKEAVDHLATYLEQFEAQVQASGGHVFWAQTGRQAAEHVVAICGHHQATLAIKAKSMTSEEIGLNQALLEAGIEPVETDLGEYIIQLAGETPSHITAPALHKSRAQIGKLFQEKLGCSYTDDPQKLTQIARSRLREKFLQASVGISGVNFAVAETGSIVLITNEGNGRMCTTLPRVHIALMGIEKIIPTFDDLQIFLRLLARSSTGQRLTSYVSIISGPRKTADFDGPEELHVIILDNERTSILAHPHMRESLFCIRCGACLNTCPVYQRVGGHAYGWVYPGPIGAVLTPEMQGLTRGRELPYASSLCGSCSAVCPVKINIHHMLLWLRKSVVDSRRSPWTERLIIRIFAAVMKRPRLYRSSARLARLLEKLFAKRGKGLPVPGWSLHRDFPPLAKQSFHDLWKQGGLS